MSDQSGTQQNQPNNNAPAGGAENTGGQEGAANRPDWLPEKFWDTGAAAPRVEDLAKSYREAEKLIAKRAGELDGEDYKKFAEQHFQTRRSEVEQQIKTELKKGVPEKPDDYKAVLSEQAVKEWKGERDLTQSMKDDPAYTWFTQFAHQSGLSQQQFEQGLGGFLGSFQAYHANQLAGEMAQLGDNAQGRIDTLKAALAGQLGDRAGPLAATITSAAQVQALEALLSKIPGGTGRTTPATDAAGGTAPRGKTKTELETMMKDERYWHPARGDQAYRDEVSRGFAELARGK